MSITKSKNGFADYITVQQIFNFEKIQEQVIVYFVNSGALIPNPGLFFYVHVRIL